eukprot:CAMPEP_0197452354 /NCGR_PEP_ID=MMETSP1175-20131217/31852_1 /TAXON_ID=1003142 /ORGANISM="Triceratium dubium, Strain CCMP147" /LENGTH=90 /DNA_ID=CAMNT_0042985339 /DNA_START=58 /DNA_END=327 /DNA_ORIENTATION=-
MLSIASRFSVPRVLTSVVPRAVAARGCAAFFGTKKVATKEEKPLDTSAFGMEARFPMSGTPKEKAEEIKQMKEDKKKRKEKEADIRHHAW